MIAQSTIAKIIENINIVDVIGDFVTLKKRGVNYLGLCPFHNEKTPSFSVSPSKEIFKCFGCGKAGNAIHFLMEHEQFSYPEAIKYLGKKYHIEIEEKELTVKEIREKNERESLLIVSAFAQKHFSKNLYETKEGKTIAYSYFKERGFSEEIIKKFNLGYGLVEKDFFTKTALKNAYDIEFLEKTGLSIVKENYQFDRFAGRVIFPIQNISGHIIGFGGRILGTKNKKIAKYLNSPESEIYIKNKELYGIYFAKKTIVEKDKCLLVEGYTDVISLYQSGIENVVASSGTSLTIEQINLIRRFTKNITILYDSDKAGLKATFRAIDMILKSGMNANVLQLPENQDPDSFARELNSYDLKTFFKEKEQNFLNFKINLYKKINDTAKKSKFINNILASISAISDQILRSVYIKECSKLLEIKEEILYTEINKQKPDFKNYEQIEEKKNFEDEEQTLKITEEFSNKNLFEESEKEIIRLILKYHKHEIKITNINENQEEEKKIFTLISYIFKELIEDDFILETPIYKQIFDEFALLIQEDKEITESHFVHHQNEEINKTAIHLLSEKYELSNFWKRKQTFLETEEMKLKEIIIDVLLNYKLKRINFKLKEIDLKINKLQEEKEENFKFLDLFKEKIFLDELRSALSKQLEIVVLP